RVERRRPRSACPRVVPETADDAVARTERVTPRRVVRSRCLEPDYGWTPNRTARTNSTPPVASAAPPTSCPKRRMDGIRATKKNAAPASAASAPAISSRRSVSCALKLSARSCTRGSLRRTQAGEREVEVALPALLRRGAGDAEQDHRHVVRHDVLSHLTRALR